MKQLLGLAVTLKIASFLIAVWAFRLLPFCQRCWWVNFLYPRPQELKWFSVFKTWDGQHYLYLSQQGYVPEQMSNAFFPLWPWLIRAGTTLVGGNSLLVAMVLAHVFSLVVLVLFYKLVRHLYSARMAFRAGVLLLTFPTAFYLHLPYSEALFLCLVVGGIYALVRRRWLWAAGLWYLMPLARVQGMLMIVPLIVEMVVSHRKARRISMLPYMFVGGAFMLGVATYFLFMQLGTGSWNGGFAALKFYGNYYSLSLLLKPWEWVRLNFLESFLVLHGYRFSVIDRLFFAVFLLVLALGWRRMGKMLMSVMMVLGLVVALSGTFTSYPRYLLVVFPMYIVLARVLGRW